MAYFGHLSAVEVYPEPDASVPACHVVIREINFTTGKIAMLVRRVGLIAIPPVPAIKPRHGQVSITNVAKRSDEGPSGIADP